MVRRTVLLANACGLAVGLLVLAACGGGSDLESGIDRSVDRVQALEDQVELLEEVITTSTTAPPPPATLATAPPTTRAPGTTTTETTLARSISDASEAAILELVGGAAWDVGLPIPADCIRTGAFTQNGEGGVNGGEITCTVDAPTTQVQEHFRIGLSRVGFPFSIDGDESGFAIDIGGQATIIGRADDDRTALTIEQRFS